ncbi:MAG: S46 family peptidase [Bacteroidales bacterium]
MKKIGLIALLATFIGLSYAPLKADEGMWLINLLEKNLTKRMKKAGLKLDPKVIYDETNSSISDAVVALDFGCTGSMVSQEGLLITNHHCAYGDIHSLSTPEKNYLEEGFWAMKREQEIPIPGKSIFFLRKVIDVSEEVSATADSIRKAGGVAGMRRISYLLEKKYNEISGMESMLSSMWRGTTYYLFFYEVYTDIRLVGAPPVSVAAFGHDVDNWEWPQHKGDFALYRVYANSDGRPAKYSKENRPLKPVKVLNISTKGIKEGDYTMVIGFPGRTNRYQSSFAVNHTIETNPVSVELRSDKLRIINQMMQQDPEVRLKYADFYFSVSNVNEYQEGEIYNFRRFNVAKKKEQEEQQLQQWIESDSTRNAKWGTLLSKMKEGYKAIDELTRFKKYYQETLVSGKGFIYLGNRAFALNSAKEKEGLDSLVPQTKHHSTLVRNIKKGYAESDLRVERKLMEYQLNKFLTNVPNRFWGDYIVELNRKFNGESEKIAKYLFENSIFLDPDKFESVSSKKQPVDLYINDPLVQLVKSSNVTLYNNESVKILRKKRIKGNLMELEGQYTRLLYQMKKERGDVQYPDANSTMRITYGNVTPLIPSDGIYYASQSTSQGLIDKYDPTNYDFNLNPKALELVQNGEWGRWGDKGKLYVNFLSNNDITGGNSGSPVLNAKGDIIGLAFDGNKESLAGNAYFHPNMNKCVNVDIRYVLWILDKVANAQHLIEEMNLVN